LNKAHCMKCRKQTNLLVEGKKIVTTRRGEKYRLNGRCETCNGVSGTMVSKAVFDEVLV
jgi:hypothetical protein